VNARARIGVVTAGLLAAIAALAFVGVNYATKPVSWMPVALAVFVVTVIAGLTWALRPAFASAGNIRIAPYLFSVIGLVVIFVAASYFLLFGFGFAFGGKL
jgi:hypothetical protein